MTDACTSPGSRSTPLVLALAREPRLRAHSHIDERSSGFFALGVGEGQRPARRGHLHLGHRGGEPAPGGDRGERGARAADRPDRRPPARAARASARARRSTRSSSTATRCAGSSRSATTTRRRERGAGCARSPAARCAAATGERPGPVHLNWPLREPLVAQAPRRPPRRRARRRAAVGARSTPARRAGRARRADRRPRRGVIVARAATTPGSLPEIPALAAAAGYPLLADPLSGARSGRGRDRPLRRAAARGRFAAAHAPEVVIRVGDLPTSKPLRDVARRASSTRARSLVDPQGAWQDPAAVVEHVAARRPARCSSRRRRRRPAGSRRWRDADARAAGAIARELGDQLSEPNVARTLADRAAPRRDRSSSPRRCRCASSSRSGRCATTPRACSPTAAPTGSTARSRARSASPPVSDGPVVALIGDVAFAHDLGGLLAVAPPRARADDRAHRQRRRRRSSTACRSRGERDVYEQHIATADRPRFRARRGALRAAPTSAPRRSPSCARARGASRGARCPCAHRPRRRARAARRVGRRSPAPDRRRSAASRAAARRA